MWPGRDDYMADMGTLHSKGGEQVLSSYMHCGTKMLVGAHAVQHKLHKTQNTIKLPTCRQGLHSFCCAPNDLYTAPRSQQQEETVDVQT